MFKLTVVDFPIITAKHYKRADFNSLLPGVQYDCVITPGNSFGIMDGGFDLVVAERFPQAQTKLQDQMRDFYGIEINVGDAAVVTIGDGVKMVYAPTMRTPSKINDPTVVYRAALAAFQKIVIWNKMHTGKITKVVMPLFGTSTGGVPPIISYKQIELAYNVIKNGTQPQETWNENVQRHLGDLEGINIYLNRTNFSRK